MIKGLSWLRDECRQLGVLSPGAERVALADPKPAETQRQRGRRAQGIPSAGRSRARILTSGVRVSGASVDAHARFQYPSSPLATLGLEQV